MQPIPLEPGMRVRCVRACDEAGCDLVGGRTHEVILAFEGTIKVTGSNFWHDVDRFKPIVRVKAPCIPSLDIMIKRAKAWFDALTPTEQEAHMRVQRDSYVRGEMELSRLERDAGRTRHIFAAAH